MAPSEMVAWECGACTFTNEDVQRRDCQMCMTERPLRYAILPGAAGAASARTTTVNRCEQARIAASAAVAPAADVAVAPADAEQAPEVAQEQPERPAPAVDRARAAAIARVVGTLVDVVGTSADDRGRSCSRHTACGHQLSKGSVVRVVHERMAWRDQGRVEDVLAVYAVAGDGTTTCKVGFLPLHLALAVRPGAYDGVYARIIAVYGDRGKNLAKRQKFWRNKGCCVAKVIGLRIAHEGGD
jgi:hypothetical protein